MLLIVHAVLFQLWNLLSIYLPQFPNRQVFFPQMFTFSPAWATRGVYGGHFLCILIWLLSIMSSHIYLAILRNCCGNWLNSNLTALLTRRVLTYSTAVVVRQERGCHHKGITNFFGIKSNESWVENKTVMWILKACRLVHSKWELSSERQHTNRRQTISALTKCMKIIEFVFYPKFYPENQSQNVIT